MKKKGLILLLACGLSQSAFCHDVIPGLASFEPPAFFNGFRPHRDPGDNPLSGEAQAIEYLGKGNSYTHFRQLNVGTRAVGSPIGAGKRVTYATVTDDDLKVALAKAHTGRATNTPKVEEIKLADFKAFRLHCVVPMPQIHDGIIFLFDYIWIPVGPNQVIELKLVGSDMSLLETVRESLTSFKITPRQQPSPQRPEVLPIVKLAVQLGDVRSEIWKASGKRISSDPSSDLCYTGEYFVGISYRMPNVTSITYYRSMDPQKVLTAIRDNVKDGLLPILVKLDQDEIQQILSRHAVDSNGTNLTWKPVAENRWQRSDGAHAGYSTSRKYLAIATKESWPNLIDFQK